MDAIPADSGAADGPRSRQRRRRSATRAAGPPPVEEGSDPGTVRPSDGESAELSASQPDHRARPAAERGPRADRPDRTVKADRTERIGGRSWRDLTANAPSQVGVDGALRARDVARPTEEDIAAAERDVVIVRRRWEPPAAGR